MTRLVSLNTHKPHILQLGLQAHNHLPIPFSKGMGGNANEKGKGYLLQVLDQFDN